MHMDSKNFEFSTSPKPDPSHRWIKLFLTISFIFICIIVFGIYQIVSFLNTPGSRTGVEMEIAIPPGTRFHILSVHLKDIGAITNIQKFEILAKFKGVSDKIKSGRFLINTGWKPLVLLDHLINGTPILDKITIPEGLTWWETGKRLEQAGLVSFEDFEAVVHDPEFLKFWGIPFRNAEGFLFPDTYLLTRPFRQDIESAKVIVSRLIDNFWRRTAPLWPNGMRPSLKNANVVKQPLILASIIEKETGLSSERRRIAGVYENRLSVKMPLQADPTVIYGLGKIFNGKLYYSHLKDTTNLYNTYRYRGLPPGPICSPGLESIRAALNPEEHGYYYFVSRGDGSHIFSTNFESHKRMAKVYRAPLRKGDTSSLIHGGVAPNTTEEDILLEAIPIDEIEGKTLLPSSSSSPATESVAPSL